MMDTINLIYGSGALITLFLLGLTAAVIFLVRSTVSFIQFVKSGYTDDFEESNMLGIGRIFHCGTHPMGILVDMFIYGIMTVMGMFIWPVALPVFLGTVIARVGRFVYARRENRIKKIQSNLRATQNQGILKGV